jgi:D-mannonate dehydratase
LHNLLDGKTKAVLSQHAAFMNQCKQRTTQTLTPLSFCQRHLEIGTGSKDFIALYDQLDATQRNTLHQFITNMTPPLTNAQISLIIAVHPNSPTRELSHALGRTLRHHGLMSATAKTLTHLFPTANYGTIPS